MKSKWKKLLSLLLTLSIVSSFAVFPASAASGTATKANLTASFENGTWSSDKKYTVDVVLKGNGSFGMCSYGLSVQFAKEVLAFESAATKTSLGFSVAPNVSAANADGSFNLGDVGTANQFFNSSVTLATLTFSIKDPNAEAQSTILSFDSEGFNTDGF